MPDKPLTVFTYAASASLAAVALVYFFHPNYLFDINSSSSSASSRKKGIVGLFNPANDCFINCNLQSLAGLGYLRIYLIRELHRRELGGPEVYESVPTKYLNGKEINAQKLLSLQSGEVTKGLKNMIDSLNERPIHKKTISAIEFIRVLEHAFGTTISKAQQDAQELLQLVAERLREEYHAGRDARKRFRRLHSVMQRGVDSSESLDDYAKRFREADEYSSADHVQVVEPAEADEPVSVDVEEGETEDEDGFPLEGQTQARVECEFCHFVPNAKPTSFVMLNLMVPQQSSSSLNDCFDAHFKTEYIDDYKCDKCRLNHAIESLVKEFQNAKSTDHRTTIESNIEKLKEAVREDPEKPPKGVVLPDSKLAPRRKIARHIEIKSFPKVLVVHLSRSIFDPRSSSTKNLAKVTFPERFPVGGLLNRRTYKLLSVVTHKGTHNSGHYETFRRQHVYAPFSNPNSVNTPNPYSPFIVIAPSPHSMSVLPPNSTNPEKQSPGIAAARSSKDSVTSSSPRTSKSFSLQSTQPSSTSDDPTDITTPQLAVETATPAEKFDIDGNPPPSVEQYSSPLLAPPPKKPSSVVDIARLKRRKKPVDRWWRISDDKIKECKTGDVLGMTREVYMLFYEME